MIKLTYDDVTNVIGRDRFDNEVIAKIVAIGATPHDLLEAVDHLIRGDEVGAEAPRSMSPSARLIYDILADQDDVWAEPDVR